MVKVDDRRKLKWCLIHYVLGELSCKWASKHLEITPRRFQQLYAEYKATGKIPDVGLGIGRPRREIPDEWKKIIKLEYEKACSNAVYLEKTINARHRIHISHNAIHQVLLELEYADHEESKQKRRKPWIRYERHHSLSLVHMDWHHCDNGKYLISFLDDASRKILAAEEFDNETTENSLTVLKQAYDECRLWYSILSVVTDHGSQFYANKRDVEGCAEHGLKCFLNCKASGIFFAG